MSNQKTKPRPARSGRAAVVVEPARPSSAPPRPAAAPPQRPTVSPQPARPAAPEDAKRAARMERQGQARAAAARRRQMRTLRNIGIVAAVVLVVGGVFGYAMWKDANLPGQAVPQQASPHLLSKDAPHAPYTNDPPTSGPHVPEVPPWGVAATPLPKELQVHGLEDGGVVINYQPNLDPATLDKLKTIVSGYPTQVILSPYPGLSDPIVLTAWNRIERFSQYDEPNIRRFVDAFRGIDHHNQSGS